MHVALLPVDNTFAWPILDLIKILWTVARLQTKSLSNVAFALIVLSVVSSSKPITLLINELDKLIVWLTPAI